MLKQTVLRTQGNLAVEDFFRGITEKTEIIEGSALVRVANNIRDLPTSFSGYYGKQVVIPYIKDIVFGYQKVIGRETRRLEEEAGLNDATDLDARIAIQLQVQGVILKKYKRRLEMIETLTDFIKEVRDKSNQAEQVAPGKDQATLPNDIRYGAIAGLPVSKDVASLVQAQFDIVNNPQMLADGIDKAGASILTYFKWAKVPANPFAYPRNLTSNLVQWTMSGADVTSFVPHYIRALNSAKNKDKWYNIAREAGVLDTNVMTEEITNSLDAMIRSLSGVKSSWETMKRLGLMGAKKAGDWYGAIDDIAKIARIRYAMEVNGKTKEEAVNIAQETHYDYSLTYDLVRAIRDPSMTRGGVLKLISTLFPTYTQKTIAYVYDTMINNPATFIAINLALYALLHGDEDDDRKKIGDAKYDEIMASLPEWIQANPMVRIDMTLLEDGTVDVSITDLGYVIPYGSLATAGQGVIDGLTGGGVKRIGQGLSSIGLGGSPLQMVGDYLSNKDSFTGKSIYFEHDSLQLAKDTALYGFKQFAPGLFTKAYSLSETRHPVTPRVFGINTYIYNNEDMKDMRENQAKRAKVDASMRGGKYKRQITEAKVKFEKGEITKEERNERISEAQEDVEHWKRLGQEAYEDISGKSPEAKVYSAMATKVRSSYKEFKKLAGQAKKNEERFKDFKKFKADPDKMGLVKKKKFINQVDKQLSAIKKNIDKVKYSSLSKEKQKKLTEKLEVQRVKLLKKASQLIKDMK